MSPRPLIMRNPDLYLNGEKVGTVTDVLLPKLSLTAIPSEAPQDPFSAHQIASLKVTLRPKIHAGLAGRRRLLATASKAIS